MGLWNQIFGYSSTDKANEVLNRYADLDRLTGDETRQLQEELGFTDEQSRVLQTVLGDSLSLNPLQTEVTTSLEHRLDTTLSGQVTSYERGMLRRAGFSPDFITTLAGRGGNAPLQRRAAWLGNHATTETFRSDFGEVERRNMLLELSLMGGAGSSALNYLHEIVRGEDSDDYTPQVRAAALGALISITDDTTNTEDDLQAAETIQEMPRLAELVGGMVTISRDLPPHVRRRMMHLVQS